MGKRERARRRTEGQRPATARQLLDAAWAFRSGDTEGAGRLVADAALDPGAGRLLDGLLEACLTRAWGLGWQPADVVRVAGREQGARAARLATGAIAAEARRYAAADLDPRWADQLRALGAEVHRPPSVAHVDAEARREGVGGLDGLAAGARLLGLLHAVPPLPLLWPPPGGPTATATGTARGDGGRRSTPGGLDPGVLAKVRALLAKAESTTFPEEAEALSAKAQELMARHAIDRAVLEEAAGSGDGPSGRRIGIDDPYASAKVILLTAIARANRCSAVWVKDLGFATVFGFEADLAAVEVLHTSLLVQGTTAVVAAGRGAGGGGRSRSRSFRQSFLVAYAERIGERLREAAARGEAAAAEDHGPSLLPVLAARSDAVEEAMAAAFPTTSAISVSAVDAAGWAAGRAAADVAVLDAAPALPGEQVAS